MKKALPYRETETGIRIPEHKIKWMPPQKSSKSKAKSNGKNKDLDFAFAVPKIYSDLAASNFNMFMQHSNTTGCEDPLSESEKESDPSGR